MNAPPLASAGRLLRSLVKKPGGTGLAIAAVTLPLIFLLPDVAALIVLAALLIYPLLDAPRTLGAKSWWRAALVAVPVWFVVFVGLIAAVDSVRPLRDDAMVYLAPFMLYPLALALAGFVRLEGRINARPAESGPRTAAKVIGVTCALLLVFPLVSGMIPVLQEKFTGNTPANTSYSNDGEVSQPRPIAWTCDSAMARLSQFALGRRRSSTSGGRVLRSLKAWPTPPG